jgi:hypothetical protein
VSRLRSFAESLEAPRAHRIAVTTIVLVLLVATAATFGRAERLKLERSPIGSPRIARIIGPACRCPKAVARLRFTLRRAERIDASIVDAGGNRVRTLAVGLARPKGPVQFGWRGRDDRGQVVRDGLYRLKIELTDVHRAVTIPTPIRVDTHAPRVVLVSATPRTFSPDGDGRADRVRFRYRSNEAASPEVYVRGALAAGTPIQPAGAGSLRWRGRIDGVAAPQGTYTAWVQLVDAAGNRSAPSRLVFVRIRFVSLRVPDRSAVVPGTLAFRVGADAKRVTYVLARLGGKRQTVQGSARPGLVRLRLPARLAPGRYVLEVTANGRDDRTTVVLRRRG